MTKLTESNPQGTANIADDRVLASGGSNFLLVALDSLIYKTPEKIVDFIEKEKLKTIIGNPPFCT